MKGSKIRRISAPPPVVAANDNFSAARNNSPARSPKSADARSAVGQGLRRFVRVILVASISAWVVLWISGAFVVGMAGIAIVAAAFAGWHLLLRRRSVARARGGDRAKGP